MVMPGRSAAMIRVADMDGSFTAFEVSEAQRILTHLRSLRSSMLTAWQERAVILSREEQQELKDEINRTCELLTSVTRAG